MLAADEDVEHGAAGAGEQLEVFGHEDAEEAAEAKHARKGFGTAEIIGSVGFTCGGEHGGEGCFGKVFKEGAHVGVERHGGGVAQA